MKKLKVQAKTKSTLIHSSLKRELSSSTARQMKGLLQFQKFVDLETIFNVYPYHLHSVHTTQTLHVLTFITP